ncbi:hypothetical protein SAY86_004617 [Trapa natans]|uniref:non-specific serine/threonine protein kinase n=1 Tax=Trapa natans TaxID=22666 RepID=A0AAN7RIZ8_TRANT|nr:hypothetical protein SAY86_004617 [Trapa natans]
MVPSASQKKPLLSLLTHNLTKLRIPSSSSSSSSPTLQQHHQEFEFSDVFGPLTSHNQPTDDPSSSISNCSLPKDPYVIHNRSHSFVGPSPRFPQSIPLPFTREEALTESDTEPEEGVVLNQATEEGDPEDAKGSTCSGAGASKVIGVGDFERLRVVGKGAFGKVFMVRKKDHSNGDGIYAMKVMRKDTIIKKNHVDYMRAERDILAKVVHPFIVPLRFSFQTKSKLYLILDFINGGHLFFHLYRQGIFSEDQARFYTAQIVSAVSHLHSCGIVHRDLKPENILMDADGYVMLTDFGLAKEIDGSSRSNSMCGTTEYMAPEILLSKGHNKDADWWSVGILLYEMLNGQPPFTHTNRQKLQQRIINEKVKFPPRLTAEAHSLLKGLLQKEPSKRLGSGPDGGEDIKRHRWFRLIKWKKLEGREILPKFKPDVSGRECIANFDRCWTTMPLDDSPAPTPTAGEHFQGFTYIAPNPWLSSGSIEE